MVRSLCSMTEQFMYQIVPMGFGVAVWISSVEAPRLAQ